MESAAPQLKEAAALAEASAGSARCLMKVLQY